MARHNTRAKTPAAEFSVPRALALIFCLSVPAAINGPPAAAQTIDPHELYERRCAGCHMPHAGEFVHDALESSDKGIVGRATGKELGAFLAAGHGKLTPAEIEAMVNHLVSILRSGAVYRNKCLICHDRAVVLARSRLTIRDGRLVGRYSGREVSSFLQDHGRLEGGERATITEMLERQLATMKN